MIFSIKVFINALSNWRGFFEFCKKNNLEMGYKNKLDFCFYMVVTELKVRHNRFKIMSFREFYNYYGIWGIL